MQCYTELVGPSGVTNAISLPFTAAEASNLVVARTSILQIFSHKQINNGQDCKLVLVAEYQLAGTITSLGRVKVLNSKSGGEALLVAFREAKLSLIEWNPEQHHISTISIHYYEGEDIQSCPWDSDIRDSISRLTVDPSSRCAAFNFGTTKLAIIPFHQLGDDLVMDDLDSLDDADSDRSPAKGMNGEVVTHQTPYEASFVWPLTRLDSGLLHPIDIGFLYEYRQPTIGILYSTSARSSSLQSERTDVTVFAAFELDIDQKATTKLFSVSKLPNDLFKVIPLPLPVGGALLVGSNELVHVEQGGKTNAIAVNEFAKRSSSFSMADQSDCKMRLEGCQIEQLGASNGDMLAVLSTGETAVISFRIDGRSVSGVSIRRVIDEDQIGLLKARASCITPLEPGRLFIGSEDTDSVLISTVKKPHLGRRQSSRTNLLATNGVEPEDEDDADDDDDDLYADTTFPRDNGQPTEAFSAGGLHLRILDRLPGISQIRDAALGRFAKRRRINEPKDSQEQPMPNLELAVVCGSGQAGGVAIMSRNITPIITASSKLERVGGIWSIARKNAKSTSSKPEKYQYEEFLIVSKNAQSGPGESVLYSISGQEILEKTGTEFDISAGSTVEVGSLGGGSHTVQILSTEIRVYDADFGMAQIWPIGDEDDESGTKAVAAHVIDPYVLILKDDQKMLLLRADDSGELDEVELPSQLADRRVTSAVLFADNMDTFETRRFYDNIPSVERINHLLAFLGADGSLGIYSLPNLDIQIFQGEGLHFLTTTIAADLPLPKHWKSPDALVEILIADLGDEFDKTTYLIVRTSSEDVTLYCPYSVPGSVGTFRFCKIGTRRIAAISEETVDPLDNAHSTREKHSMRHLPNLSGFSTVFVSGKNPGLIMKNAASSPRIHILQGFSVISISSWHVPTCSQGFVFVDNQNNLHQAQLPPGTQFGYTDWIWRKIELGEDVTCIDYFESAGCYVIATSELNDFRLPQDDEWHTEWRDDDISFLPQIPEGSIKLLSPRSGRIISSFTLEPSERALCIKSLNLEISEETHERKDLVVVGTAITKGENISARGNIYIFDVVDVVPEPEIPESDLKLKLVAKEEVRGSVTALSRIGSQGFLLAAQGQKCMVRGLKEDLSILPVAFMDMKYYVKVAKELKGTGLCILGDAMAGLWFVGYSEEPYKLQLFGRDQLNLEVMAAEFLPDGKHLFILAADGDGDIHVMQFDPEHPQSERGTKLLHRSSFRSGSFPTTMTLLPRTAVPSEVEGSAPIDGMELDGSTATQQILVTTQEGGIALITPLSEQAYRRLSTLQNILITNLEHACGLNPRAYRAVETDGIGGRAMIDGNLVLKWIDQSSQHKSSMADKLGASVWEVQADLEAIGGGGLGFL